MMDELPLQAGILIVLDWGTTNVRAALLDENGSVIEERRNKSGVGTFTTEQFAIHFDEVVMGWPDVPAIAAGMVGSRQGWHEADYILCPTGITDLADGLTGFGHGSRTISIVPGIKLMQDNRFDVMRGEESQLAGWLDRQADFSGTVIMPGTHSKWVQIVDGTITDFRTYMTGELFEAISEHTILRHSVSGPDGPDAHFATMVKRLAERCSSIEGELFGFRARHLLEGSDAGRLRQELSALLIMAEVRAGQKDGFHLDTETLLIGTDGLTEFYGTALKAVGVQSRRVRGTQLVWPALFSLAGKSGLIKGNQT